ncbi:sensor histidine kinase [Pelagerythrobacter marinus]|uniref:sensor histidine kinase n=1 Tax=Pelagerythrobacter marinus TaxID=538382 RepID=UPI002036D3D1|nr:PAS domain-containing protein [Pelagerythrobacter marinus]USA40530.1 PAS domain-containing protein [Pelagerythrobacter marinus]WPZ08299.1 PAS domain-containing protein [Pelagerythrobacter marinus]
MSIDFEALFARSPNPYVVLDRDLVIVWMNDAYLRVTMRERDDIVGKTMFDAFPSPEDSDSHRQLRASFARVLETREVDEIALIRYDIRNPDGSMDAHYWSATHTPFLGKDGEVAYILQHTVNVTELHGLRRLRDEVDVIRRAAAVELRNRGLEEESQQLKRLLEQAPGFVCVLQGPEHRFVMANAAYRRLIGDRPLLGLRVIEALPEVVEQGFVDLLDEVRASGRPYFGSREKIALRNRPDAEPEQLYLEFIYQPIFDEDGEVSGVFVQGHDVTEEVEAEERQRLLINELNHRVKNTLAIVQGLAQQSFARAEQPGERALESFSARLSALASAHNLLTACNWEAADLRELITGALEATAGPANDRYRVDGPDVVLRPQPAVALAMIVHELSTNAIKYGALSCAEGRIAVSWRIVPAGDAGDDRPGAPTLVIDWAESGGPPVSPPEREGFGSRLIRRGLGDRGGKVELDYRPEGLRCRIEATL